MPRRRPDAHTRSEIFPKKKRADFKIEKIPSSESCIFSRVI